MTTYIIRRLMLMIPTLIGVTAVVFFVMALAPGGFGGTQLNEFGGQTEGDEARRIREYMMRRYGLNKPVVVQYGRWLNQISPVGFRNSSKVELDQDAVAGAKAKLAASPLLERESDRRMAEAVVLEMAKYQHDSPAEMAERVLKGLENPVDGVDLLELTDAPLDTASKADEQWLIGLRTTADRDMQEARRLLLTRLQREIVGRDRVLFTEPIVKKPDLGLSLRGRPVLELIGETLPITVLLNAISFPLIYLIAITTGVYAARHRGKTFDVTSGVTFLGLYSFPVIWAGVLAIGYLANKDYYQWFPTGGLGSLQSEQMAFMPTRGAFWQTLGFALFLTIVSAGFVGKWLLIIGGVITPVVAIRTAIVGGRWSMVLKMTVALVVFACLWGLRALVEWWGILPASMPGLERGWLLDSIWHLTLPVICLTYGGFAFLSKLARGATLESISSDFVRTARAKGVGERDVLFSHVLRNSMLPLITVIATILPAMLGGSVIVERIFSIQGMGNLGVEAAFMKDRELVMGTTLIGGLVGLTAELLRDVWYAIADPRVSYE